ncbi:hypothetical protein C8R43DRAFT_75818 [Mycena crocata]|nr:hypothetical protein C8R43DRAFT_75818 [Mycena crocata]
MDQNGFEFKPLRANIAPAPSNNPPFSMLQRPNNSRKPFSFIQTQSRNNTENHSAPSTSQIPQISTTRRHVEPRMKQEPSEHTSLFPNARQQHTLIPQARNESKMQPPSHSHKLRAFTMMPPTYDNQSSFDTPQYSSSPKGSFNVHHDSRSYAHSNPNQSQEPLRSHSVAHSRSPSVQIDPDFDAEDADLSQLMSKRIREAKMVKSKLAEEVAYVLVDTRILIWFTAPRHGGA